MLCLAAHQQQLHAVTQRMHTASAAAAQVAKVYCLVRDKKGQPAHERLRHTLASPLFHELHAQHAAATAAGAASPFERVVAVQGDLAAPGLGLSDADANALAAEVTVVLHCAALVVLDADVHRTLRCAPAAALPPACAHHRRKHAARTR